MVLLPYRFNIVPLALSIGAVLGLLYVVTDKEGRSRVVKIVIWFIMLTILALGISSSFGYFSYTNNLLMQSIVNMGFYVSFSFLLTLSILKILAHLSIHAPRLAYKASVKAAKGIAKALSKNIKKLKKTEEEEEKLEKKEEKELMKEIGDLKKVIKELRELDLDIMRDLQKAEGVLTNEVGSILTAINDRLDKVKSIVKHMYRLYNSLASKMVGREKRVFNYWKTAHEEIKKLLIENIDLMEKAVEIIIKDNKKIDKEVFDRLFKLLDKTIKNLEDFEKHSIKFVQMFEKERYKNEEFLNSLDTFYRNLEDDIKKFNYPEAKSYVLPIITKLEHRIRTLKRDINSIVSKLKLDDEVFRRVKNDLKRKKQEIKIDKDIENHFDDYIKKLESKVEGELKQRISELSHKNSLVGYIRIYVNATNSFYIHVKQMLEEIKNKTITELNHIQETLKEILKDILAGSRTYMSLETILKYEETINNKIEEFIKDIEIIPEEVEKALHKEFQRLEREIQKKEKELNELKKEIANLSKRSKKRKEKENEKENLEEELERLVTMKENGKRIIETFRSYIHQIKMLAEEEKRRKKYENIEDTELEKVRQFLDYIKNLDKKIENTIKGIRNHVEEVFNRIEKQLNTFLYNTKGQLKSIITDIQNLGIRRFQ